MHPLRRKPTKLLSKCVIVSIWAASLAFALPMGLVHTFAHVPVDASLGSNLTKPFCYIDLGGPQATNATLLAFKSYT